MWQNNTKQFRARFYVLKQHYGQVVYLRKPLTNAPDLQTGRLIRNFDVNYIRRAVIADTKSAKDFVYDLSYVAANKNFSYGGIFDKEQIVILIDIRDLNQVPDNHWDFVLRSKQHTIMSVNTLPDYGIVAVTGRYVEGSVLIADVESTQP